MCYLIQTILLIILLSCNSILTSQKSKTTHSVKSKNEYIQVKYEETSCGPSWLILNDDKKTKLNLLSYLKSKSIVAEDIIISGKKYEMVCMACICKTGRIFKITINMKDLLKAIEQGFTIL